jgi:hypothetical protein
MALQKTITDERGVTATYFRVTAIIEQYVTDVPVITVQLLGYTDESYSDYFAPSVPPVSQNGIDRSHN